MFATGTTELIWHFAGYLRLPDFDYATPVVHYNGEASETSPDLPKDVIPHEVKVLNDFDFPGDSNAPAGVVDTDPLYWHIRESRIIPDFWHPHVHLLHQHSYESPPFSPAAYSAGGGEGATLTITATYQSGGDQELIDVRQVNILTNDNVSDNGSIAVPTDVVLANNDYAASTLTTMLYAASDTNSHELLPTAADTSQLIGMVNANDADPAAMQAQLAPYEVQPGVYVNGELYTGSADPHQVTNDALDTVSTALNNGMTELPPGPTGDGDGLSNQTVSVGSDITANSATLVNLEGATVSLAVLGNYYQTQEIAQTNVLDEVDHVTGGAASQAIISIAPNTIDNIADFQDQTPTLTAGGTGTTASGLNWSVDVLNGSLYDVQALVQTNYLTNNNVIYETTSAGISEILVGGNVQVNGAEFENLTANYNLIIVEGSYYQDNLISQTNVLLDSNKIGFGGDGSAAQSFEGGGNTAINDASIINDGNYAFQPITDSAMSVINSLESQQVNLDVSQILSAFPDLAGNINVLVVTGNYYDINYISQTNIISNANTVMMLGSADGFPGGALQTVETGHDMAVNAATIYDAGSALSPYLQGSYYTDQILIQSNIVADGEKITGSDPSQLVSELVAFTGTADAASATSPTLSVGVSVDLQHHHASDSMGDVLH
jgi:hypothetical protein